MALAWLEQFRADLARKFNLRGQLEQYPTLLPGIQPTYDVAGLLGLDPASDEPDQTGRALVIGNPGLFGIGGAGGNDIGTGDLPVGNEMKVGTSASEVPFGERWYGSSEDFPTASMLGWFAQFSAGMWAINIDCAFAPDLSSASSGGNIAPGWIGCVAEPTGVPDSGGCVEVEADPFVIPLTGGTFGLAVIGSSSYYADNYNGRTTFLMNIETTTTYCVGIRCIAAGGADEWGSGSVWASRHRLTREPVTLPLTT